MTILHLKTNAQDMESWVAILNDEIIGHIFMKQEPNQTIKFLDAWVSDDHRRKGVYRLLWDTRWNYVNENYVGYKVYAWCKEKSLPLLLEKGFKSGEICTYVETTVKPK
jgi:hypothetical protein